MKITAMLILFTLATVLCFGVIQFNLGADVVGNHNVKVDYAFQNPDLDYSTDNDYDAAMGISPAFEYMLKSGSVYYGFGVEYQVQRDIKFLDGKDKMGFIPLYGVFRYQLSSPIKVNPELIGQAGYNFFTADDNYKGDGTLKGGLYWGVGAGLVFNKNITLQVMYKTNYGNLKGKIVDDTYGYVNYDADVSNSQINIALGYRM